MMPKYPVAIELLNWYHLQSYNFPWRNTDNPYAIWLSEVMLQQTRVATVLPYYKRWISELPDIQSVSDCQIDNILKLWEGLGYYNRARNFYKACKIIIQQYRGKIPRDPIEFSKLPGVGPYICGAVMSIAFKVPIPAIDGNAVRVISRLNSIDIPYPQSKKVILGLLKDLIDPINPGYFNESIMDLGREVCTPKGPSCSICPINSHCQSYVNNTVDKFPISILKVSRPHYHVAVGVIWHNNKILISKRNENRLLGGLWEFPGGKRMLDESGPSCVIRKTKKKLNILVDTGSFIKKIKHTYSHFSITVDAYNCQLASGQPRAVGCADFRWIYPYETHQFAFHRASHKLFDKIDGAMLV